MARWLLTALVLVGASAVPAQELCRVDLGRGWATGFGQGRIVMRNTGVGCGAMLDASGAAVPIQEMQLLLRPQHGVVTLTPPRFTYTPEGDFTGRDSFSLSARGIGRDGRPIELRGEVTVEVSR